MSRTISRRSLFGLAGAVVLTPAIVAISAIAHAQEAPDDGTPTATIRPTNRPRGSVTPRVEPTATVPQPTATLRPTARPRTSRGPSGPATVETTPPAPGTTRPTPRPRTTVTTGLVDTD